jgi:hypothetical protein
MNSKCRSATFSSFVFTAAVLAPLCIPAQLAKSRSVAVLVTLHAPAGLNRRQLEQGMAESAPTFKCAPDLIRKYLIFSEDQRVGGIYLWKDRQAAEAWHCKNPVFRAVVPKNADLKADITYFDVPIVTNGPGDATRAGRGSPVVVLVEVPVPPGVDRGKIEAGMAKSVPTYETAPGLICKYFIFSDDQKFGGIYLWESREAAEAWYRESVIWHNGVSKVTGLRAALTYFEVPIVVDGPQDNSSNRP